jgi:hypothetical protein
VAHHFAAIFGLESLGRIRGFSLAEMALPNQPTSPTSLSARCSTAAMSGCWSRNTPWNNPAAAALSGQVPFARAFFRNTGWRGGPAPAGPASRTARRHARRPHQPARVFDCETGLDHIADDHQAMDERRAIKSLVRVAAT